MRKAILSLYMLLAFIATAFAQTRQVTGKVVDKGGEALIGVSVGIKGSTVGTSTDAGGNFKIKVSESGNVVLVFKYLGFKNREVTIGSQSQLTVRLEDDATTLDEVVVVGYGTQKRKDLTAAVASISGETVQQSPVSNIAEALTGRLPGVSVSTTDGAPGAEIVIRVRGGGSVTQDNSPLYIVDGFPVDNINGIASTDVESIDVLKDASSTAIYGSRGANGVVIITTKKPKAGKTTIAYNGFGQARTFPRQLDVLSPYEFTLAQYEYAKLSSTSAVTVFNKYFGVYDDLELYKNQKATNWQKELFGNAAKSQQHNLSINGGTEKTKMSFSITRNDDEGLMLNSGYKRNYFNFKLNHEIAKTLKVDLAARYTNAVTNGAGTSGSSSLRIGDGLTTRPVNGLADFFEIDRDLIDAGSQDDYDQFLKSLISPIQLADQDYRKRTENVINLNGAVNWTVIKNLAYRSEFGVDLSNGETKRFYGPLTGESRNVGGNLPLGEITDIEGTKLRWANTLNYKFSVGRIHKFNVLLGQELLTGEVSNQFTRAKYFAENIEPERLFSNMALGTMDNVSSSVLPSERIMSFFGRVNYDLLDRFNFQATLRGDGSSKFAKGNRWGYFPSISGGWRISDEAFLKGNKTLSELKLRVSYGEAGNNRIQNDLWRQLYGISALRTYGAGDVAQPYWVTTNNLLPNPDLKWETTITRDIGLDFGLFRNKVYGNLDFYRNTTKNLLVTTPIPQETGYPYQQRNIGQTSNKGVELGLTSTIISKKDFKLTGNFNIGINRSKIDKLDGNTLVQSFNSNWAGTDLKGQDDYRLMVGKTVGLMWGYVTDGYYTVDDFETYNASTDTYTLKTGIANNSGILGVSKLRPGFLKLKDLNGDGAIDVNNDRQIIGNAQAKHTGGFGFNAKYKNFDLATFFNWSYGGDVYNTGKISFNMLHRTTYGNMLNTVNSDNRFKYIDAGGNLVTDLETLRELNKNATIWSPFSMGTASPVFHSWAVEDGSFLRLNNITLGYSLPKSIISKIKMSQFRVYGTVYNAFLWTNYSGYDPEVSATRNSAYNALTPSVDYSAYPKSRTFTIGINASF